MLLNISRNKGNQTMKFGQVIEHNKIFFSKKKNSENDAGKLVPDLFLFFKKTLYEVRSSGLQLSFNILRQLST